LALIPVSSPLIPCSARCNSAVLVALPGSHDFLKGEVKGLEVRIRPVTSRWYTLKTVLLQTRLS
jgi:hypothetical protein